MIFDAFSNVILSDMKYRYLIDDPVFTAPVSGP